MLKGLILFILSFVLWCLWAWPFDPVTNQVRLPDIYVGLGVSFVVMLVMREFSVQLFRRFLNPIRYFWFAAYAAVFTYYLILANLDVAYRVLHPALPIHPGIVKVKTSLKTATAKTVLANSITLTPGTLTVDITEDNYLYVHWINITTTDPEKEAEEIVGRFEWYIRKIYES